MNQPIVIATCVILVVVALIVVGFVASAARLYMQALVSGAPVTLLDVIGMRLRRVDAKRVINARIQMVRGGTGVTLAELESHTLAGGDLEHVTTAMIAAKMRGGKELDWKSAAAMDLAGFNVVEYVDSGAHDRGVEWRNAPRRRRVM